MKEISPKRAWLYTILKYVFSLCLTFMVFYFEGNGKRLFVCLLELSVIFFLSNILVRKSKVAGILVNTLLMFLYNAQMLVYVFARSYISYLMLSNLDSLEDIGGNAASYIGGITLLIIFTMLPIRYLDIAFRDSGWLSCVLACYLVFTMVVGAEGLSPMLGLYRVYGTFKEQEALLLEQERLAASGEDVGSEFYKDGIIEGRDKPQELSDKPNVIILFTEGLSSHIIEDERNIMPNVARYQSQSISFSEYYNHTFATYRGLIGQLFSGYQRDNYDSNSLISLQDIFKVKGYHTFFLNTEPNNREFTQYLGTFGFEELINPAEAVPSGRVGNVSDGKAYEYFWEKIKSCDGPFFGAMYTLDTHVSFVANDRQLPAERLDEVNKFYNVDYYFGDFMEKLESSGLLDNTIVVFTADHCTFTNADYYEAFPDIDRSFTSTDRMPLFIYYKGVKAENINAFGRNTLCLAPTLLDFLDISVDNYFLGDSLFAMPESEYSTLFYSVEELISTRNGRMAEVTGEESREFVKTINRYFAASRN